MVAGVDNRLIWLGNFGPLQFSHLELTFLIFYFLVPSAGMKNVVRYSEKIEFGKRNLQIFVVVVIKSCMYHKGRKEKNSTVCEVCSQRYA